MTPRARTAKQFRDWKNSMSDDDFVQMVNRGQLNRTKIAKEAQISKSSLDTNSDIRRDLYNLEEGLRERNVLPPVVEASKESNDTPKTWDVNARDNKQQSKRVSDLEQQVIELKARLKRYDELSEVLADMGYDI